MQPAPEVACSDRAEKPLFITDPATGLHKLFSKLLFLIPLGVIGNIIFSMATVDRVIVRSMEHFKPGYLALAMLLSVVPWLTGSLRLLLWGRFLGKDLHYRDTFRIAVGAELGAAVSPPMVGGGPVKTWMLMQRGFPGGTALSLTVLESFEDAVFFLIMVPVALTVSSAWALPMVKNSIAGLGDMSSWILPGSAGLLLLAVVLAVSQRSIGISDRFTVVRTITGHLKAACHDFVKTYQNIIVKGKTVFALTMAITTIQWVCRYSIISLLLLGLGIAPRPLLFMALQVIVFALLSFIPTPGGVGGAETIFYIMYRPFLPPDMIGIVTAGWRFFTFYFLLLLAAALFLLFRARPKEAEPAS